MSHPFEGTVIDKKVSQTLFGVRMKRKAVKVGALNIDEVKVNVATKYMLFLDILQGHWPHLSRDILDGPYQ